MTDKKVLNKNKDIDGDKFWSENFSIIYQSDRLTEFFPNYQMTMIEKLNALTRMSIYLGIVLSILLRNYLYLYIIVIGFLGSYFVYKTQLDNLELYFNSYDSKRNRSNERILLDKPCTKPTVNNPMMNFNIITDKRDRSKACDSWNSKEVKKEIEDKFNYNLYRNVSDLYGKNNSQRQYYTMPSTTMPNDQTAFAKWCYNTGPTCKERSLYCAPIYSPVKDNTNVRKYVPQQF